MGGELCLSPVLISVPLFLFLFLPLSLSLYLSLSRSRSLSLSLSPSLSPGQTGSEGLVRRPASGACGIPAPEAGSGGRPGTVIAGRAAGDAA